MGILSPIRVPTDDRTAELDRLGDEIAELAAHLDAATARLLDLIREFDTRCIRTSAPRSRNAPMKPTPRVYPAPARATFPRERVLHLWERFRS